MPLELLFSGSVFYPDDGGLLQTSRIPWDGEAEYRLPVAVWRETMEQPLPGHRVAAARSATPSTGSRLQGRARAADLGAPRSRSCWRARMSDDIRAIADAVLYEGYVLWPYRRSALKNRAALDVRRRLPAAAQRGATPTTVRRCRRSASSRASGRGGRGRVRFLHVVRRELLDAGGSPVDELLDGEQRHLAWDEATERELGAGAYGFAIRPAPTSSRLAGASAARRAQLASALAGGVDGRDGAAAARASHRVTVRIENTTAVARAARPRRRAAAHVLLDARRPPRRARRLRLAHRPARRARATRPRPASTTALWPVLVGEEGERHTLLSSPIILEDHPQIAPESPGDLFDGGEIDQLLILNILSLTDEEQDEMRATDPRTREILERTEASRPEELHAPARRHPRVAVRDSPERIGRLLERAGRRRRAASTVGGVDVRRGSRVRLRPRAGGDVFDLALADRLAVVDSIEEDAEGATHLAVTLDDDPGRDLGARRPLGHRFFFALEEVEPVEGERGAAERARVLVAGIGNVFLADDGFGVEVARRLGLRELPDGVDVADFGIRGMDLAYALQESYDDRDLRRRGAARGGARHASRSSSRSSTLDEVVLDTHGMDPLRVLALARAIGRVPGAGPRRRVRAGGRRRRRARRGPRRGAEPAGRRRCRRGGRARAVGRQRKGGGGMKLAGLGAMLLAAAGLIAFMLPALRRYLKIEKM